MLRCIFGPNLVILAWTADELWGGQAEKEVKFDFQVKFDLEGRDRSSPKTIGTLTKVFCTFVPNLVILAWTSGELSCGQASDWYTHTRTHGHSDTQTQATTIPEGQNWPRVKMIHWSEFEYVVCQVAVVLSLLNGERTTGPVRSYQFSGKVTLYNSTCRLQYGGHFVSAAMC